MTAGYDFDIVEVGDVIHFTTDNPRDIDFEGRVVDIVEDGQLTTVIAQSNWGESIEIQFEDDWLGADHYDIELLDWAENN